MKELLLKANSMLTIDLRMYRMSGIGRYLRNVVPLVLPLLEAKNVRILGSRLDLAAEAWSADPRVKVVDSKASIYGIEEQALVLTGAFRNTDLLWVPHYSVPLLYRGRLAVTIHDVCHLAMRESLNGGIKRGYARVLFENVARRASAVFCVSDFTASEVQKYLPIPQSKIYVTRLGLDVNWNANTNTRIVSGGNPYFLYVGNVKPNKNLGTLLRAFRQIADQIPHRLVVVGKMSNMKTVDDAVIREAATFSSRVHLAGEVSDELLKQYYRGAEFFVFPSLYEGFGLPLLEAMGMGCPVLSSSASSLPEVAGDAALYFNPRDSSDLAEKLLQIASSPSLRAFLVERGFRRLKMFSYQDCATQTARVLNMLMTERDRR
jgi:glycosyltransferase involved in cell wall biosynthesis